MCRRAVVARVVAERILRGGLGLRRAVVGRNVVPVRRRCGRAIGLGAGAGGLLVTCRRLAGRAGRAVAGAAGSAPVPLQHLERDAAVARQLVEQLRLQQALGNQLEQRPRLREHAGATLRRRQVAALGGDGAQLARQRHRLGDALLEGLGAVLADEGVRIVLGRQEEESEAAGVADMRQHRLHRACRRPPPGRIAVEAEDQVLGEAQQLGHMVGGAGGAQRRHRVAHAELRQRDHVHVAFGDQDEAALADRRARLEQAVELAALQEDRRLGRVQVFRLALVQHPPAEADDLALGVADREHDAVAEAVVAALLAGLVLQDDQAGLDQLGVVVFAEGAGQAVPARRRIAQAEARGDLAGQAAALQIVDRAAAALELAAVVAAGLGEHVHQRELLLAGLGGALALARVAVVVGHGQAQLAGQILDRLDEAQAAVLHQEADRVAMHAAAEAVVGLARGADDEAGRLLAVEGAQALVVDAGLLQRHGAAHHVDDVGAGEQVLDEALGYHAAESSGAPGAPGPPLAALPRMPRCPCPRSCPPKACTTPMCWPSSPPSISA